MLKNKKKFIAIALTIILIVCCIICNNVNTNGCQASESTTTEECVTMYAADGRTIPILKSEVEAYLKVGWYLEPVTYLWFVDESRYVVKVAEVEYLLSTGNWFLEKPMVNQEDMLLLARVIHAEATENPNLRTIDRQYVGSVVMNRLKSGYWGDKLANVVYARGQYACVGNKKFNSYPPQECLDIAKQLLLGISFGVPENVIYQAQFRQGSGVWKVIGVHYYCYR